MTPVAVAEELIPAEVQAPCETDQSDADLLQGLGALAELFTNASETLKQCLLTIDKKLSALGVGREEWVPIPTARSAVERVSTGRDDGQVSQERIFGGVPVMIMRLSAAPVPQVEVKRCEWHYELGYAVAGDDWAVMIRTASFNPANEHNGFTEYSDLMPLRDAPLELQLKAIPQIPSLFHLLNKVFEESTLAEIAANAGETVEAREYVEPEQIELFPELCEPVVTEPDEAAIAEEPQSESQPNG
jgi:hypothetical protein